MNCDFNKLYFALVEYYYKNGMKIDVHALCDDSGTEEFIDLDLLKPILPYGYEEKYFVKSLIPFSDVLYKTRISWGILNAKDAIKMKETYIEHYFTFLRNKGITDINDLEDEQNIKPYKRKK